MIIVKASDRLIGPLLAYGLRQDRSSTGTIEIAALLVDGPGGAPGAGFGVGKVRAAAARANGVSALGPAAFLAQQLASGDKHLGCGFLGFASQGHQ